MHPLVVASTSSNIRTNEAPAARKNDPPHASDQRRPAQRQAQLPKRRRTGRDKRDRSCLRGYSTPLALRRPIRRRFRTSQLGPESPQSQQQLCLDKVRLYSVLSSTGTQARDLLQLDGLAVLLSHLLLQPASSQQHGACCSPSHRSTSPPPRSSISVPRAHLDRRPIDQPTFRPHLSRPGLLRCTVP